MFNALSRWFRSKMQGGNMPKVEKLQSLEQFMKGPATQNRLSWSRFAGDTLRHGDMEIHLGDNIFRGPIKDVVILHGTVVITIEWVARRQPGGWEILESWMAELNINPRVPLHDIGDDRTSFEVPGTELELVVIFPKNGSVLYPQRVKGHPSFDPEFRPPQRN